MQGLKLFFSKNFKYLLLILPILLIIYIVFPIVFVFGYGFLRSVDKIFFDNTYKNITYIDSSGEQKESSYYSNGKEITFLHDRSNSYSRLYLDEVDVGTFKVTGYNTARYGNLIYFETKKVPALNSSVFRWGGTNKFSAWGYDDRYIYLLDGLDFLLIRELSPESFEILDRNNKYLKDKDTVICLTSRSKKGYKILESADAASFEMLERGFYKDDKHYFYNCSIVGKKYYQQRVLNK